jgi:hypothetical protein
MVKPNPGLHHGATRRESSACLTSARHTNYTEEKSMEKCVVGRCPLVLGPGQLPLRPVTQLALPVEFVWCRVAFHRLIGSQRSIPGIRNHTRSTPRTQNRSRAWPSIPSSSRCCCSSVEEAAAGTAWAEEGDSIRHPGEGRRTG